MNGWLLVARISCSARARLILFRLIISFLLNTARSQLSPWTIQPYLRIPFMAYSRLDFFSLTRYTFPTSPFPINFILSKLLGPTSTFRTLIEFELYVLRKAMDWRNWPGEGVFEPLVGIRRRSSSS